MKKLGRLDRPLTPAQGMTSCALIQTNCNWVGPAPAETLRDTVRHARRRAFNKSLSGDRANLI